MARIRTIKPEFFTNEEVAAQKPLARLMFIALWTAADRSGRIADRPDRLKVQLLPFDRANVDALLSQLNDAGLIERYEVDGRKYIQITNFSKHQRPHRREPESDIPPPRPGKNPAATDISGSGPTGREGNGLREGKGMDIGKNPAGEKLGSPPSPNIGPDDPTRWPAWLADEWCWAYKGSAGKQKDPYNVRPTFEEMLRRGVPPEKIRDRIRDPSRNLTEPIWEFEKFFAPKGNHDRIRASNARHTYRETEANAAGS